MDACFEKATKSLFRFEGLQDYTAMDGEEEISHFIKTGALLTKPQDVDWCRNMKLKNERGMFTGRVRMVVKPLNNYTKWELAWHKAAAEFSGDDIRIIDEDSFKAIFPKALPDFWMMDDKHVFTLVYGPQGKFIRGEQVPDDQVGEYINYKNTLIYNSVHVREYL